MWGAAWVWKEASQAGCWDGLGGREHSGAELALKQRVEDAVDEFRRMTIEMQYILLQMPGDELLDTEGRE